MTPHIGAVLRDKNGQVANQPEAPPAGVVAAWWMALASAVAMVVTSIPSGDLFSSASWLPLVTLVPLLPARGWWRPRRPDPVLLIAGAVLAAWAWRLAPDLVRAQDVAGGDPHGVRVALMASFHQPRAQVLLCRASKARVHRERHPSRSQDEGDQAV